MSVLQLDKYTEPGFINQIEIVLYLCIYYIYVHTSACVCVHVDDVTQLGFFLVTFRRYVWTNSGS